MKVKKLSLFGYRSVKDVTWRPADLNVLIGPNASGKSNLLRGIELVRTAGTDDLEEEILRQGGIGSVLWNNEAIGRLGWTLESEVDPQLWPPHLFHGARQIQLLTYHLLLQAFPPRYAIEHESLCGYTREPGRRFDYLMRGRDRTVLLDIAGNQLVTPSDRVKPNETILAQATMLSSPVMFYFHDYLKLWGVYQDLSTYQNSPVRKAAITRTESRLAANGQNLVTVLHTLYTTNKQFKTDTNDAMRAAFGREFESLEFTPAEDQRIQMRLRWKSVKSLQSAADLSDGTLRFLMLLAILLNRSRGDLVAIDEPETGLHPSMFPIIAELAAEASRSSQIIFSTHSPEFLTAVGQHHPMTTVVQNVEGETRLSTLEGEDLKRWLEKYTLGELFVSGGAEALT